MALQKWQQEVEVTKLPKMLQEKYTAKLKNGESREYNKYRLSHFEGNNAVVNDLSNDAYKKYAKERSEEKAEKRRKQKEPLQKKLKEVREERNKLKSALKSAESGSRSKARRLERKKAKALQLKAEIEALEKEI